MQVETAEFICIMCPVGCNLSVTAKDGGVEVTGNACPRGKRYGEQEFLRPQRVVTTLIRLEGGGVVPVKTADLVDKASISDVLKECAKIKARAPIKIGDVLIENVCGSGVNIVATKNIPLPWGR